MAKASALSTNPHPLTYPQFNCDSWQGTFFLISGGGVLAEKAKIYFYCSVLYLKTEQYKNHRNFGGTMFHLVSFSRADTQSLTFCIPSFCLISFISSFIFFIGLLLQKKDIFAFSL